MDYPNEEISNESAAAKTGAVSSPEESVDVFDIDDFEDVNTGELVIKHPETGRPTGLVLILAGPEHPIRKKKKFQRLRDLRKEASKTGKVKFDDPAEEDDQTTMDIAECILGWRGMVKGGVVVPFTYEAAVRAMRDPKRRWLRAQAKEGLEETELFIKACDGK